MTFIPTYACTPHLSNYMIGMTLWKLDMKLVSFHNIFSPLEIKLQSCGDSMAVSYVFYCFWTLKEFGLFQWEFIDFFLELMCVSW